MKVRWIKLLERAKSIQSASIKAYQQRIKKVAMNQFSKPWLEDLKVVILIGLKDKRGCMPDLDNLEKPILDALNGIAYNDDKQIKRKYSECHFCGDPVKTDSYILPPRDEFQKIVQLERRECIFIGIEALGFERYGELKL